MALLRKIDFGFSHWCEGCKQVHYIQTDHSGGPNWTFSGDMSAPTFHPSVRIRWTRAEKDYRICHYFITEGNILYCSDTTHALKGQTVPLKEIPEGE